MKRAEVGCIFILQSECFFVEAVVVLDLVQSLFLERSLDPMQNIVYVILIRPEETVQHQSSVSSHSFSLFSWRRENARLQGLNRGERLKLPSFWEINGWKTSVRNWT